MVEQSWVRIFQRAARITDRERSRIFCCIECRRSSCWEVIGLAPKEFPARGQFLEATRFCQGIETWRRSRRGSGSKRSVCGNSRLSTNNRTNPSSYFDSNCSCVGQSSNAEGFVSATWSTVHDPSNRRCRPSRISALASTT